MKNLVLVFLLAMTPFAGANTKLLTELKTVNGGAITIPQEGLVQLVFIDIWASYGGHGPEAAMKALPDSFRKAVPTIWIQPRLNVTDTQVLEYQEAFPISEPLVIDDHFQIMRRYAVDKTPSHVLLKDGNVVFSGNTQDFLIHMDYKAIAEAVAQKKPVSADGNAGDQNLGIPSLKGIANLNRLLFSPSDDVLLIFLDDICPMPCAEAAEKISQNYRAGSHHWIAIYNSMYSTPATAKEFSEKHNLNMPAYFDEERVLFDRYKVYSTPYFIRLNDQGEILFRGSLLPHSKPASASK